MEEKLLEAAITSLIKETVSQSTSLLSGLGKETKQLFGAGLKRYLQSQKGKYSHIKTLLKGLTPVFLYEIYYPLKITNDNKTVSTKSIKSVFKESSFVTIIGDAGSGKSTLIKHLFLNSIYEKVGIPILVELRDLNKNKETVEEFVHKKIFENRLSESKQILERMLNKGMFIFFLDGFDELNAEIKKDVVNEINSFVNRYGSNKYILTTRPYSDIELMPLFHNYFVKELSFEDGEIEGFIFKQLQNEKELAQKIVASIKSNRNEYIDSFLTNPLLLSLYILTFQSNADIPNKKYIFYRRVINALFSEHDSKTKLGFVREKKSNLNQEQFEEILKAFCFLSYFEDKYDWDVDYVNSQLKKIKNKFENLKFDINLFVKDLKSSVSLWVDDYGTLSFAHRSLQEYFAALFIKDLNPQSNRRMYKKIVERFAKIRRFNEVENFLSLCEEMDTLNFKTNYCLPILEELRDKIDNRKKKDLVKSFLQFFADGVYISKNYFMSIKIKRLSVYKGIYLHFPYTQKLHRELTSMVRDGKFDACKSRKRKVERDLFLGGEDGASSSKKKAVHRSIGYINLAKTVPDDFLDVCYENILEIAEEFDEFIDREIKETQDYINQSFTVDEELVEMI